MPKDFHKPSLIMLQYSKGMYFALSCSCAMITVASILKTPSSNLTILISVSQFGIIIQSFIAYDSARWKKWSALYSIVFAIACIFHLPEQNLLCMCASSYTLGRILNYHYIMGRMKLSFQIYLMTFILAQVSTGGCCIALLPIIYAVFHCYFLSDVIYSANIDMSDKLEELILQDKHKDVCFAALIHELRNPLTTYFKSLGL
jgi:hypothetical protein